MRRKQACGLLAATLLTLTMAFGRAPAAEKVAGDRLLPPDVYLFVEVPSVPELKARMGKTLSGQLLGEPALADFWKEVEEQIEKLSSQLQNEVGVGIKDMLAIPSGQVTVAVERVKSGEVGLVIILDYGSNTSTVDKLLSTAEEKLKEQGAEKSETTVDGTQVVVHTIKEKEAAGQGGGDAKPESHKLAWFNKDSHLVVSSGLEHAESVLSRWDGKNSRDVRRIRNTQIHSHALQDVECRTEYQLVHQSGWPDSSCCRDGGEREPSSADGDDLFAASWAFGIESDRRQPRYECGRVRHGFAYRGLCRRRAARSVEHSALPRGGTLAAEVGPGHGFELRDIQLGRRRRLFRHRRTRRRYSGAGNVGQSHRSTFATARRTAGSHQEGFPRSSQRPRSHGDAAPKEGAEASENPVGRVLFSFDAKDADKLKATVEKVAKMPDFNAKSRDFSGTTLYEFTTGVGEKSALAIVDNSLMFATDVSMIEQVVRADSDQQPLSESAEYRKIASHFPSKASAIGFEKQDAQAETVYEMVRTGKAPLMPIPAIDFSKLPPFSEIKKYLSPTGSFAVPDEHGAYYETYTLPKSSN